MSSGLDDMVDFLELSGITLRALGGHLVFLGSSRGYSGVALGVPLESVPNLISAVVTFDFSFHFNGQNFWSMHLFTQRYSCVPLWLLLPFSGTQN